MLHRRYALILNNLDFFLVFCKETGNYKEAQDLDHDYVLRLPINGVSSVKEALAYAFGRKVLEECFCFQCGKLHTTYTYQKLIECPRYLILQIIRFDNSGKKLHNKVFANYELDVSSYVDECYHKVINWLRIICIKILLYAPRLLSKSLFLFSVYKICS